MTPTLNSAGYAAANPNEARNFATGNSYIVAMTVAFDTLKFAQTPRDKAKVPQDQAEGMAQAFADATGEQIATKSDLKETELRLDGRIAEVRYELLLLKWMMGFVLAFQAGIFARLFLH